MPLGLTADELRSLYYTLLKELGCSSNAARICELYLTDDLHFKRDFKFVGSARRRGSAAGPARFGRR